MTFRAEQGHQRVLAIVAGIHYLTKPTYLDVLINTRTLTLYATRE
jgi:hypothetical protein